MLTLPWISRHTEGSALTESVCVKRFFCAAFTTLSRKLSFAGTLIAACLWSLTGMGFLPSLGDPFPCWKLPRAAVCRTPRLPFPFKMCPPQHPSLVCNWNFEEEKGFFLPWKSWRPSNSSWSEQHFQFLSQMCDKSLRTEPWFQIAIQRAKSTSQTHSKSIPLDHYWFESLIFHCHLYLRWLSLSIFSLKELIWTTLTGQSLPSSSLSAFHKMPEMSW